MKLLAVKLLVGSSVFLNFAIASAQVGEIAMNGNGCSAQDTLVKITPGAGKKPTQVDLRLAGMTSGAGELTQLLRKSCNVAIPVAVPKGWRVVAQQGYLRFNSQIASGDQGKISQEMFLAGAPGKLVTTLAPTNAIQKVILNKNSVKGECGVSVNLRLNVSSVLQKTTTTSASVLDVTNIGIQYSLAKCK